MRLSRGICALLSAAFLLSACAAIAPAQDRDLIFGFTPVLSEAEMRLEFNVVKYRTDSARRRRGARRNG